MPTRSPGDGPAKTIRDLGLPGRAVTALAGAGITGIDDLAALTRRDLAAIEGLGPAMIAAIRRVVPEPAAGDAGSGLPPESDRGPRVVPAPDGEVDAAEESRAAPPIPSVDSLRGPRRRTAVDVLVPGRPAPPVDAPAPAAAPPRAGAPRPAEYADLVRLGVRVARAVAGVPVRVALWSAREPVRCLRRVLGARAGSGAGAGEDPPPRRG